MRVARGSACIGLGWLVLAACAVQAQADEAAPRSEAAEARESEGSKPEDLQATRQARQHFQRGMQHFQEHRYREAIRRFRLAAALVPSADLWFNIASAHEQLGEYAQAAHFYELYLRDRVDPPDAEEVRARIESLKKRAALARKRGPLANKGVLQVHAEMEDAQVQVRDRPLGTSPLSERILLRPATYAVEAEKEGYIPFRAGVEIEKGQRTAAYVTMEPETRYRSVRGDRVWTWAVASSAAVALLTSAVLGGVAMAQPDDQLDDARRWAQYSDIALGTGLVLGVGATVLYFLEGRVVRTERITAESPPR